MYYNKEKLRSDQKIFKDFFSKNTKQILKKRIFFILLMISVQLIMYWNKEKLKSDQKSFEDFF